MYRKPIHASACCLILRDLWELLYSVKWGELTFTVVVILPGWRLSLTFYNRPCTLTIYCQYRTWLSPPHSGVGPYDHSVRRSIVQIIQDHSISCRVHHSNTAIFWISFLPGILSSFHPLVRNSVVGDKSACFFWSQFFPWQYDYAWAIPEWEQQFRSH